MADLPAQTAVIAHDAGAANIILAWVRAGLAPADRIYLEGPAARLWDGPVKASLEEVLDGAAAVLTGTGWQSDVEFDARKQAAQRGLHTIAVIDHWTFYDTRFVRNGETVLPDEIGTATKSRRAPSVVEARTPEVYVPSSAVLISGREANDSTPATVALVSISARPSVLTITTRPPVRRS